MAIDLPPLTDHAECEPYVVSAGGVLKSPIGGSAMALARLGDRMGLDVTLPDMTADDARRFRARRSAARALGVTLRLVWPQEKLEAFGAITVNGAGQAGMTLNITGGTAGKTIPEGAAFSVTDGSRHYVYMARADLLLTGGALALPITPMIRRAPANGSALNFAAPVLEGLIEGEIRWTIRGGQAGPINFKIEENR